MMVQAQIGRDHQELVLAAVVAGGAAVAGMAAPQFLYYGGHPGAEYVFLGAQILSPVVFIVAGLVAFLVYRLGQSRVHHVLLAAITAVVVGAIGGLASPPLAAQLAGIFITGPGAVDAALAVLVGLVPSIALRRRRRAVRAAKEATAAASGSRVWAPRLPVGVIVLLAALVAGAPMVVGSVAQSFDFLVDTATGAVAWEFPLWAFLAALPSALAAAWAVTVVLLVDQWVAPRPVRALIAGVLAAVLVVAPALAIAGGLQYGGETAALGLFSGLAVVVIVFCSERRVVPAVAADPVGSGAEQPVSHPGL
jgi:hypothetical protein